MDPASQFELPDVEGSHSPVFSHELGSTQSNGKLPQTKEPSWHESHSARLFSASRSSYRRTRYIVLVSKGGSLHAEMSKSMQLLAQVSSPAPRPRYSHRMAPTLRPSHASPSWITPSPQSVSRFVVASPSLPDSSLWACASRRSPRRGGNCCRNYNGNFITLSRATNIRSVP